MFDFDLLEDIDPQDELEDEAKEDETTATHISKVSGAAGSPSTLQVQFCTLGTGVAAQLHLHTDVTAVDVKQRLQLRLRVPWVEQRLIVGNAVWEDGHRLGDVHQVETLEHNDPLQVTVLRVPLAKSVAISGSRDGALIVWDIESGSRMRELSGHDGGVNCVAVHWASHRAVSGGEDRNLRIWDLVQGKLVRELEGHAGTVSCLDVVWSRSVAISGSSDNTLRLWDLEKGTCDLQMHGHTRPVTCVAFDELTWSAISGSEDCLLFMWDLDTGQPTLECRGHVSPVRCLSCNPGLTAVVSGGFSVLKFWDLSRGKRFSRQDGVSAYAAQGFNWHDLQGHTQEVTCVSVDLATRYCITGSSDTTLCLWKPDARVEYVYNSNPARLRNHTLPITCLAVDWPSMCAVSGDGDCLIVWDLKTGGVVHTLRASEKQLDVSCVAMDRT